MKRFPILPPTYLFMSILVMVVLHFLFPVFRIIPFPWSHLGIILLLFGFVINMIADKAFKKHGTVSRQQKWHRLPWQIDKILEYATFNPEYSSRGLTYTQGAMDLVLPSLFREAGWGTKSSNYLLQQDG